MKACGGLGLGVVLALLAASASAAETETAAPAAAAASVVEADPVLARIERHIDTVLAVEATPALAYVLIRDGAVVVANARGVTDTVSLNPVDGSTAFRLASVSKGFASTLLALLEAEGYVAWNDRVNDLLPGLKLADPVATRELTLEQLLSHRTGLPHHTLDVKVEGNASLETLIEALDTVRPACAVGQCYAYQNVIYSLGADIAHYAVGNLFEVELQRRVFIPLGMNDATVGRDALMQSPSWARPHVRKRNQWSPVEPKPTYYRLPAAAGVNASAEDLAQWMRAQLGEFPEVLPPEVLETVHSPQVDTPYETQAPRWRRERLRSASYALGWRVFDYAGESMVFHAGAVQGFRAMVGLIPERRFGFALLWNSDSGIPGGIFPNIVDAELGLPDADWLDEGKLLAQIEARQKRHPPGHAQRAPGTQSAARGAAGKP